MGEAAISLSPRAQATASRWTQAALSCEPADRARAESAVRVAYRAAGHSEPSRILWLPSLSAALDQLRQLLDAGHTSLVSSVRKATLNGALSAARAPVWEQTSDLDRFTAFGAFHQFMEWHGYYGEQRYDGVEARYDLMEHPYRCNPVTEQERTALTPVLQTVRQVYDQAHRPIWAAIDRHLAYAYSLHAAWFWNDDQTLVEEDDEARALIRYCLNPRDWSFDPAWNYYPDWLVLAAIDAYQELFGTTAGPGWNGCRDVALTAGPWWPLSSVAVMTERPTVLRPTDSARPSGDDGPTVVWPDGSRLEASGGNPLPPQ
ncbi:DUF6745 domain-containing protein [Micromonospora sediminicola]|uniref:DUF6745 domain-containing protein n=1 Tax=Micromonospora sediminicola TaxID=946078 RepID=UPI0034010E7B